MAAGTQVMEDFWGVELSKSKKEVKWAVDEDDEDALFTEKCLELRQACLGASAKEGERNVVELTADNDEGEQVQHTLLSMKVGGTEQCPLFMTLQPPVTFKLVLGTGPIHIVGQVNETIDLNTMESDDEDEEEEEEGKVERVKETTSLKRLAFSDPKSPAAKAARTAPYDDVKGRLGNGDKWDNEEEDDDDSEEDEEDSEDVNDDSEEEEMEVVQPVPKPKKSQRNGSKKPVVGTPHPKTKPVTSKTPQPLKSASTGKQNRSQSLPGTPKSEKKKGQGKEVSDINEIKERLTKMTSVPKKLEKFNNFVSNSFKIKDDSIKKQLWEFVQKNRPQV